MISLIAPRTQSNLTDPRYWRPTHGVPTTAGIKVDEDVAMTYSAAWGCTRVLSGTESSLPLPVYKRVTLSNGGLMGEGKEKARDHWLWRLLKQPNAELDGIAWRSMMTNWMVNRGNADCEKVYRFGSSEVTELRPIPPWFSSWERNPNTGELELKVMMPGEDTRWLPRSRVFHLRSIITDDGWVGKGVIQHARECVGFGIATERYGANWFGGGAVPRVAISHPGKPLDDTQRKAFREEWEAIYGGPAGQKVALLAQDAKLHNLNISAEDSQFLETRKHNIEEICRWYGVPPHLIQRMEQVTYNNVEMLGIDFVRFTLTPWLMIWETAIATQLLGDESDEYFAEHNVNGLMRGDSAARSTYYRTMVHSALMTRNEARGLENLPPVEGGDTFLVQGATVPLDDDGRPESEFAGTAGGQTSSDSSPVEDSSDSTLPSTAPDSARTAAKIMLKDALTRMQGVEFTAATRAAKKPGEFLQWLESFYTKHTTTTAEAIYAPLLAIGSREHVAFAVRWCERSKNELLEAAGRATPQAFSAAVADVVEAWRNGRIDAALEELIP
ncbi:MAG: phage portal protein [Desulfurellales bacterium]|nr:MAG: phage portal protein [Desulfurellales bacterium]